MPEHTEHPARVWARERGIEPMDRTNRRDWRPRVTTHSWEDDGKSPLPAFMLLLVLDTGSGIDTYYSAEAAWRGLEAAYDACVDALGLRGEVEAAVKEERERMERSERSERRERCANAVFDAARAVSYDLRQAIKKCEIERSWMLLQRPLAKAVEEYRPFFDADKSLEDAAMAVILKTCSEALSPHIAADSW